MISKADTPISTAHQSSHANRFDLVEVQPDTNLHLVKPCSGVMVDPDEWFDDLDLDSPC